MSEQIAAARVLLDDIAAVHMVARAGTIEQVEALLQAGGRTAVTTHEGIRREAL